MGRSPPGHPSLEDRTALASTLRERLEGFIAEQDMPYVVTQAEFLEAGPEALKAGRPEGTMWVVRFDDPLPALDRVTYKSVITDPLQAYVEALRPEVESGQMDFVVNYIVSWRNATRDTFEISPTLIRLYLDGDIGIRELSRKMAITGL